MDPLDPLLCGTASPDFPSGLCSPALPAVPAAPARAAATSSCVQCRRRLDAMREGGDESALSFVAARCEAAWAMSGLACFGVCTSSEFCAAHCVPLPVCSGGGFAGQGHDVLLLRNKWERFSARCANPTLAKCGGACLRRLELLFRSDWVSRDPDARRAVRDLVAESEATGGACQGFCQTPYLCKVHLRPATRNRPEGGSRKATGFSCPEPHHKVANGRYHELFAFFCEEECCRPGKWFTREETHRKCRKATALVATRPAPTRIVFHLEASAHVGTPSTSNRCVEDVSPPASERQRHGEDALKPSGRRNTAVPLCVVVSILAAVTSLNAGAAVADALSNSSDGDCWNTKPRPRVLCFSPNGVRLYCVQCRLVVSLSYNCSGRSAGGDMVYLASDGLGHYTLTLEKHTRGPCPDCPHEGSVYNGTVDSSDEVPVILESPTDYMDGWSFVFH
eukprot:m51a1_g2068 hypothetical protein (450) ;mRNA; r:1447026-1448857